ncbi:MAG: hypothetical protein HC879_14965 [Leptolyngbyaceae cyanobacterium SL_5_9]|nr:hypothetical protein [Leptolyngbyaceae cyanobacterium SL_5_9]NJO73335.1 hypothetical protein [Leptolyngbyaceae cyanobacterium RM1_406_9]
MPEQLEERVAYLEAEVARLKNKVEGVNSGAWWEQIVGAFADSLDYDEAMRLGREYRDSLHPSSPESVDE